MALVTGVRQRRMSGRGIMAGRGLGQLGPATLLAAMICALALSYPGPAPVFFAEPAFAQDVPLPTPAPLPKTGSAPPAATDSAPAATPQTPPTPQTPGFFPFSDKSSPDQATAFDDKQRALLDRISMYMSSLQTMEGNFVQIGPD